MSAEHRIVTRCVASATLVAFTLSAGIPALAESLPAPPARTPQAVPIQYMPQNQKVSIEPDAVICITTIVDEPIGRLLDEARSTGIAAMNGTTRTQIDHELDILHLPTSTPDGSRRSMSMEPSQIALHCKKVSDVLVFQRISANAAGLPYVISVTVKAGRRTWSAQVVRPYPINFGIGHALPVKNRLADAKHYWEPSFDICRIISAFIKQARWKGSPDRSLQRMNDVRQSDQVCY